MLRGMATVNYWVADVEAAKAWYSQVLEVEPYFERPGNGLPAAYIEFRIGDNQAELGLIDAKYRPPTDVQGPGGIVLYWAVDDVKAAFERLLELGATEHLPVTNQGDSGFVTASVVDPFGNVLGVMENPHYLEMVGGR